MTANRTYLILDSQNHALANSELASPPGASPIRLNILNNKVDDVMSHEIITLFSSDPSTKGYTQQNWKTWMK